ncbi:NAD-dependent epimerase/dehydratase family protein [Streptomyces sp. 8L]|uniref:NAD-dependent epimerase/dehydratase family protein n=1 Tax=Streptomyces sp. 8L TaxID=2877242 RepID=UPI001CD290DC|nr:NAD-dependent epimerase/dehydratase family protein [Streptomyces sp. 8L]MCA1219153.1 NAD-dependent epimerase/dehydratase family protein [Streptomyces sp. 8L]
MRLLVLGGTAFVGRAIVAEALEQGDDVTLFGRGRTGVELFPGVRRLTGDRDTGDYAALRAGADGGARGRSWDAVVDVSGYVPRHVAGAMDALGERAGRYLFISSNAVYAGPGADEDTPRKAPVRDTEVLDNETYGRLKAACEDDVSARYGERATLVRPGKVVGPHDTSDAFPYWVRRAAAGGRVALPAEPDQSVQVVDVRDLARLVVDLLHNDRAGAYHAVGPAEPVTFADLIETCARTAGSDVEVVQVPPSSAPPHFPLVRADAFTQRRSPARARAAGLPATPLAKTAADVLAWDRERGEPPLEGGFSPAEEERALAPARR